MCSTISPPRRLGSVAARYRHPLAVLPGGRRWPGSGTAGTYLAAAGSGLVTAADPLARDSAMARLEAVLMLAAEPLSTRRLAQLADLADGTAARTLVRGLNERYDAAGGAFRVEEVAGGFQLLTRPQFGPWLRRVYGRPVDRLSSPALEALAVIAYRQPVLRAEVEQIRGVQCGEVLRQLLERDLVRVCGRSEELGRPFLYGTTRRFLQLFGLRNLDELPRADLVRGDAAAVRPEDRSDQPEPPGRVRLADVNQGHSSSDVLPSDGKECAVRTAVARSLVSAELEEPLHALPQASSVVQAARDDEDDLADDDAEDEEEDGDDLDDDFEDDDDLEDDDEEDEFDDEDDDFEDDDWEEVDDDEAEDDEEEDWDDEDDDEDDWEDEEEEEEKEAE